MPFNVSKDPYGCFTIETFETRWKRSYLRSWQQSLLKEKVDICMVSWKRGENKLKLIFMVNKSSDI